MALPETVEFTFSASDPVLAAVLNKIQEAIAGDLHPNRTIVLGASCWVAKPAVGRGGGGIPPVLGSDGYWVWGGTAPSIVVAPISNLVPVGHEITSIVWSYRTGGAGVGMHLAMWSRDLNVAIIPVDVAVIAAYDSGLRNPWGTIQDSPAYIMPANTAVELEVNIENAAHMFGGAVVTYRKIP